MDIKELFVAAMAARVTTKQPGRHSTARMERAKHRIAKRKAKRKRSR